MKREFDLDVLSKGSTAKILIIGQSPNHLPYAKIEVKPTQENSFSFEACIKDNDLERFAVNILKSIKSNKLK